MSTTIEVITSFIGDKHVCLLRHCNGWFYVVVDGESIDMYMTVKDAELAAKKYIADQPPEEFGKRDIFDWTQHYVIEGHVPVKLDS